MPSHPPLRRSRLPLVLVGGGSLLVFALWFGLQRAQQAGIEDATGLTADQIGHRLMVWTEARTAMVRFLADHLATTRGDAATFAATAEPFLGLFPGLQALNLIDPDGVIGVVVPAAGNEPALGRSVASHPEPSVREAFARARRSSALETSGLIRLYQGGSGVTTYRAIRRDGGPTLGYVNGVFRFDTLVDSCLWEEPLRANYRFRLRGGGGEVAYEYAADGPPDEAPTGEWPLTVARQVPLFGRTWTLEVAPSPRQIAENATWADDVLALVGLSLVLLVGGLLTVHYRRLEDLAESRARYQLIVEHTADLIAKIDRAGRFVYVSPSVCALLGRTEAELLGRELLPLLHEDDRHLAERALRQVQEPPHTSWVEQRVRTVHGWRWLTWSNTGVLDEAGTVAAVIGVGRDVTARKELEARVQQSQKMQEVGELAGGIAHDFNNILQAMLGNLEFVRQAVGPDHPARADLDRVVQGAARATRLTGQLLAFSRRDALRPRPTDLDRLTRDTLDLVRPLLGPGIDVTRESEPGLGQAHVDPGAIERVLTNLCTNARDAMRGAGRLRIRTYALTLDEAQARAHADASPGPWIVLEVADDGVGIDPALVPRIFEPFFTTKERGRGTGLGLSTVYGIVRQHGGFVTVESAPGAGATFRVHLPPAAAPAEAPADSLPSPPPARPAPGGLVLVAEDDELVRDFATRALRRAGYQVVEAGDGAEAVARVEELGERLDLALLDLTMPGTSGHEAARRLRELTPRLRIVFTSGYDPDGPGLRDRPIEPDDFLPKPYTLESLLATVKAAIERA